MCARIENIQTDCEAHLKKPKSETKLNLNPVDTLTVVIGNYLFYDNPRLAVRFDPCHTYAYIVANLTRLY